MHPNPNRIIERSHRLSPELYKGTVVVAYTICIKNRKPAFTNSLVVSEIEKRLIQSLDKENCSSLVHLFMPDHCHLLLQGNDTSSDSRKAIVAFKQHSGFWLSKNSPEFEWQKDFFDHIVRSDESVRAQIKYILDNPIRKQLVDNWKEYPYKGSTVYDINSWEGYY